MDNEEKPGSFKVEDKRRFTSEGGERSEEQSPKRVASNDIPPEGNASQSALGEEITLGSFVMSLATQGMMQLGEMPAPEGFPVQGDLVHAKQTIDIIAMLQEKTKGHQDAFEEKLFQEVLYSLRMAFVKKKQGK